MEVNKERVRLWAEALRSGEFEQGHSVLQAVLNKGTDQETRQYCCMGVACEVAIRNGVELNLELKTVLGKCWFVHYDGARFYMPSKVTEWYGLENGNPQVEEGISAAYANDVAKTSFGDIADRLEELYL